MELLSDPLAWARAEFGTADLGDRRRRERLIAMAAQAATTPGGKLTAVFTDEAALQTAYDWLENEAVAPGAVMAARNAATARRCRDLPFVFVPTDGSSVTVTDRAKTKQTGRLSSGAVKVRGDKVHTALAVSPDGTPLGVCAQQWWTRADRSPRRGHKKRAVGDKETQYWLDVRAQTRQLFLAVAPRVALWFQHDREADAWPLVRDALAEAPAEWTTIRAAWDRRLVVDDGTPVDAATRHLRSAVAATPVRHHYTVTVPGGPHRAARTAVMAVRWAPVTLDLKDLRTSRHHAAPVTAVFVEEAGTTPAGEAPITWLLLTTYPVATFEDACLVVYGYTLRWRIEEFHKAWQTACCDVQETQLATHARRVKWATILSAVAMRLVRLTYLARERPTTPATTEFTPAELAAMRDLQPRRAMPPPDAFTLAAAVLWIARLGGYAGQPAKQPPGMITLARGLERVAIVARAYANRARYGPGDDDPATAESARKPLDTA